MSDRLQKAIQCLSIQDVFIKNSTSLLKDGFDPKYIDQNETLEVQLKHHISRAELLTLNDDGESSQLFRVCVEMGARWLSEQVDDVDKQTSSKKNDAPEVKAVIEAAFVAEYLLIDEVEQEALNEFALKNASFHVWPYWREYLMSQCARMNLPKFALPTVQFAKPCGSSEDADKK